MFGDSAFSLPTLLLIIPIAGALISLAMLTRKASAIASLITMLTQLLFLGVGAIQLTRFQETAGSKVTPSCDYSAASETASFVLAQCSDWFPRWGIQYSVSLGWAALGLIALTTVVTGLASAFTWWADRKRPAAMHAMLWFTAAALSGLFLARDLMLFYVFFELMLVPLLILIGVWGGEKRVRASMTMFVYTLLGSLPMLVGVIVVGLKAQTLIASSTISSDLAHASPFSLTVLSDLAQSGDLKLSTWVLVSFLLAFAIKAPLLPFHGWMAISYRQAPIEVTAVLSGLISKAAFFGFLVIVLPLFPTQLAGGWGTGLVWVALTGLIWGCLSAFRQRDMRGVVIYSSLAQMGLIILGLVSYLGDGGMQAVSGAYLQTINHGLVSAGMFLFVGIIEQRTGETHFAKLGGLATGRPRLLTIGLALTLITLAVPGATTFAGELLILAGVFRGMVAGPLVATIGCIAVVLAAMYALRMIAAMIMTADDSDPEAMKEADSKFGADFGVRELLIVGPAVILLLVLSVWPNAMHRAMNQPPVGIAIKVDPLLATDQVVAASNEESAE